MTSATWVTMIGTVSIVWGGFAYVLLLALRRESAKRE